MNLQNDEMIYNWSNSLRQNDDGARFIAAQTAASLRERGFSAPEALDVMVADEFNQDIAKSAVAATYFEPAAEVPAAKRTAKVVPTSYGDILPFVENALKLMPTREFVDKLSAGSAPILRVSQRSLQSWNRLAGLAKDNDSALSQLHRDLRPWMEEAMLNSVLIAESDSTRTASKKSVTDLGKGTCDCARFIGGNFATFGLACEHIVVAADHASPHQRLIRALEVN